MYLEGIRIFTLLLGIISAAFAGFKICSKYDIMHKLDKQKSVFEIIQKKRISAKAEIVCIKFKDKEALLGVSGERITLIMQTENDVEQSSSNEECIQETHHG